VHFSIVADATRRFRFRDRGLKAAASGPYAATRLLFELAASEPSAVADGGDFCLLLPSVLFSIVADATKTFLMLFGPWPEGRG